MEGSAVLAGLRQMKKNDLILVGGILLLALAAYVGISWYSAVSTKEAEAVAVVDGKEQGRYPLHQDATVEIRVEGGGYNHLEIREGAADIVGASCPDKLCVKQRPVDKQGESLVCLPNRVVVEIENGQEAGVDGTTH